MKINYLIQPFICFCIFIVGCSYNEYENAEPLPVCSECTDYSGFFSDIEDTGISVSILINFDFASAIDSAEVLIEVEGATYKDSMISVSQGIAVNREFKTDSSSGSITIIPYSKSGSDEYGKYHINLNFLADTGFIEKLSDSVGELKIKIHSVQKLIQYPQIFGACWKSDKRDTISILLSASGSMSLTLTVYDDKDKLIERLVDANIERGYHIFYWIPPSHGEIYVVEVISNAARMKLWFKT